jgi:hypothetical protein
MTPEEKAHWRNKRLNISKIMHSVKKRAASKGLPFNLDHKYLCAIAPNKCPIFKVELTWGYGNGKVSNNSPSLDRIIPERGYVKGNVAWMSNKANMIKSSADEKDLYAVADWLHKKRKEVIHGGAIPPAMDDLGDTYLVIPAGTQIINDGPARERGGY